MESFSLQEQHSLDINWYFADKYNRLCVVASGGGVLPSFLANQQSRNNEFHEIILDLNNDFKISRNKDAVNVIVDLNLNEDLDLYFSDFEFLASKGLHVFDKVDLNFSDNTYYLLVTYPIYDTNVDPYPIDRKYLSLIPKLDRALISRTNSKFSSSNFIPKDLLTMINQNCKWRK